MGYIGSDPKTNQSVSTAQLVDDAVTNAKIVDDVLFSSVTASVISASSTVTADSFTGTFNGALSSSAQIATDISGSSNSLSSSLSTRLTTDETNITNLQTDSGSFSTRVTNTETSHSQNINQDVRTSASPTFNNITATGTVTAQEFHSEFVSASITFTSGSTKFGDTQDDAHNVTGSFNITGSFGVNDGNVHVVDKMIVGSGSGFNFNDESNAFVVAAPGNNAGLQVVNQTGDQLMQFRQSNNNAGDLILYGAGSTKVRFSSNGSDESYINTGTNVGIGTTNPAGTLDILGDEQALTVRTSDSGRVGIVLQNSSTGTATNFTDGLLIKLDSDETGYVGLAADNPTKVLNLGANNTNVMTISGSSQVGIGTTDPRNSLELTKNTPALRFYSNDQDAGIMGMEYSMRNDHYPPKTAIVASASADYGRSDLHFVLDSNRDGFIYTVGTDTKMIITEAGKVGIGTTQPTDVLTVTDGATPYAADAKRLLQLKRDATNGHDDNSFCGLLFGNNSNGFHIGYGGTTDRFRFLDGGGVERVSFVNGGNVGIGTTAPSGSLHVNGANPTVFITNSTQDGASTMIRMTEKKELDGNAGGYIHYNGSSNVFHLGTHISGTDTGHIYLPRDGTGEVGIGTAAPNGVLDIWIGASRVFQVQGDGVGVGNNNPGNYGTLHVTGTGDTSITGSTFYDGYGEINVSGNVVGPHVLCLSSTAEASSDVGIQNMGPSIVFRGQPGSGLDGGATFAAIAGTLDQSNATYGAKGNLRFFTSSGYVFGPEYGTELKERMKLSNNGEIHLGQSGGGYVYLYEVNDNSNYFLMYTHTDTTFRLNHNGSGSDELQLQTDGDMIILGTLTESSDVRLKENIKTIPDALSKVNQMRGVSYNKIGEEKVRIGMVADEVEKIIPELVITGGEKSKFDEDGFDNVKSLKYTNMVGVLVEAVKELTEKNNALEKRIEDLEK